jgi:hypothetical protein
MALDVGTLATTMLAAAKGPLEAHWKTVQPFAQTQFKNIAQQIADIEAQLAEGTLTKEQANLLLDMQKNASRAALLAVEGIGILAAQDAVNDALGAISKMVNGALQFSLL